MMISVIVPVWNAEHCLSRCVDSILAQTHTDLELILVNDGSTDASGALCDAYAAKDPRVKVIHKANGGPSAARNAGCNPCRIPPHKFISDTLISVPVGQTNRQ